MLFNSVNFLIFFPIVVILFFVIPQRAKTLWLLIASYYFYMSWNPKYALLIALTTVVTWLVGIFIGKCNEKNNPIGKKLCIVASLAVNLGILGVFKYADFILDCISEVLGLIGLSAISNRFDFLLPVGISFYTFQTIGYTIDVYRDDIKPEKNFINYALFVSFFPQLVAGPIERSRNLLTQIQTVSKIKYLDYKRITDGLVYMLYGFFMKLVIADRASMLVDFVFEHYAVVGGVELALGAVVFGIQIYCDFASYSAIAIGAAQVLGFSIMENFDTPYYAVSVHDFWKRWHISLTGWFRDYLYIPLGGNRKGKIRTYLNTFIVFLVSGLWHGAAFHFIVWGGLHGIYLIIGRLLRPIKDRLYPRLGISLEAGLVKAFKMLVTFILVDTAWIFFRADNLSIAITYIKHIFKFWNPWVIWDFSSLYKIGLSQYEFSIFIISCMVLAFVDLIKYLKNERIDAFLNSQGTFAKCAFLILMALAVVIFGIWGGDFNAQAFIYFDF